MARSKYVGCVRCIGAVLWLLMGCGDEGSGGPDTDVGPHPDGGAECTGDTACRRYNWPRLIVGVVPAEPVQELPDIVLTAEGVSPNGSPREADAGDAAMCDYTMELAPSLVCTSQWYLGGGEAVVTLRSVSAGELSHVATIASHNYCGLEVRYLLLEYSESGGFELLRDELLGDPCSDPMLNER